MPTPAHILCFGKDKYLIEIRGKVLRHAGFFPTLATNLEEYEALVRDADFELVVLCHSLTANECESAVQFTHRIKPGTRTLILMAVKRGCDNLFLEDTMEALEGPRALIDRIERMLQV